KRLLNFVGSDVLPWKKIFFFLSFTSRYMTRLFTSNDKGYVSVIVGLDYEKFCGEFLPENFNYLNINNVSKGALSYPQNTLIFELIKRYGSLSSAQLAELLNVPVESIYRGLRKLCVEEILTEDWDYYSDTNYREKNV
ncbi:MAG: hypothetical protein LBI03_12125, partial [Clostridiales bacterium]|nr:hypothetical protein [Clostridiales bacterium]